MAIMENKYASRQLLMIGNLVLASVCVCALVRTCVCERDSSHLPLYLLTMLPGQNLMIKVVGGKEHVFAFVRENRCFSKILSWMCSFLLR